MSAVPSSSRPKGTGIQRKNQAERSRICCKGKRIVLVDDSIVRGTTISNLITMLRKAGATEVHVRISSPPFLYPVIYFGTDVPSNKQLIASSSPTEEIRQQIGADSLGYMPIEELQNMVGDLPICRACFDRSLPNGSTESRISALFSKADFVFFFPLTVQILHPVGDFFEHAYFFCMVCIQ